MTATPDIIEALSEPLDRTRLRGVNVGGGNEAPYLPAYDVIQTANQIFGYDGWSYRVIGEPQFITSVGLWMAVVEVTVHVLCVTRTDVGTNLLANRRGEDPKAEHFETSIKGAVSDGLKRALRTFGDQFGLSLADKDAEAEALRQERADRGSTAAPRSAPKQEVPDGEFENVGQLLTWAVQKQGKTRAWVLDTLGVGHQSEITDLADAKATLEIAIEGSK